MTFEIPIRIERLGRPTAATAAAIVYREPEFHAPLACFNCHTPRVPLAVYQGRGLCLPCYAFARLGRR